MSALTALAAQLVNWVESEITIKLRAKWYIWYYRESATRGWKEIYEHLTDRLIKISDHAYEFRENTKGALPVAEYEDNYTIVKYNTFTLKIRGRMSVDEDLYSVCIWQYWYLDSLFPSQATIERDCLMRHDIYQFGLVDTGKFSPLLSKHNKSDLIIEISGSTDNNKVEMFNGDTGLYLRVIKKTEGCYCVRVAKRPKEVDELSLFNISKGVIRLSVDTRQALKFDEGTKEVLVGPYNSEHPEFHFDIDFL